MAAADVVFVRIPAGEGRLEAIALPGRRLSPRSWSEHPCPPQTCRGPAVGARGRTAAVRADSRARWRAPRSLPFAIEGGAASFELYRAGPSFTAERIAADSPPATSHCSCAQSGTAIARR